MTSANQKPPTQKMEESNSDKYNCFVYTLQTSEDHRMTRRDIEEHPKLVVDNDTGSESLYESDCKSTVEYETGSYNCASLVPDIDKPRGPSPDIPSRQLASKKLFKNRYLEEAENASKLLAESELKAQSRPAIIQWAPSKGYQPSSYHHHVSLNSSPTTSKAFTHISTAVTSSVPVHSTPLMADWTKDTHNEKLVSHIHHADDFQVDTEIKLGTKFHCKEGPKGRAGDLTTARHCKETFVPNFKTARNTSEEALDLSMSRKTPSPASSCYSRPGSPSTPTASSLPLTPNSSVSFTEKFKALSTKEDFTTQLHKQSGYVDLNRIKEIYTHNISAMVKSQAHEPKWNGNIQNPNTTKIYPRTTLSNGVKAAPVTVNVQNTESGKMYQCQLCNVMFKHRHHVVRHMRSHTGEKPFQCMECGARFARKCILTNHMRVHTGEKPFICRECGDMFSRKHHLVIHVRTHTGEKPYFCGKCGAAFSRSHHLGRHMKTHEPKQGLDGTVNTIEQYQCSKCTAKFAHANSLSRHVKMHNDPNFNSKFMSPASTTTIPNSDTVTTLSQMSNTPLLSSNTYAPFSTSSLYYKLDSIPVPRMDVVIPPSSSGFKPLILSSVSLEHSTIVKEESND